MYGHKNADGGSAKLLAARLGAGEVQAGWRRLKVGFKAQESWLAGRDLAGRTAVSSGTKNDLNTASDVLKK